MKNLTQKWFYQIWQDCEDDEGDQEEDIWNRDANRVHQLTNDASLKSNLKKSDLQSNLKKVAIPRLYTFW